MRNKVNLSESQINRVIYNSASRLVEAVKSGKLPMSALVKTSRLLEAQCKGGQCEKKNCKGAKSKGVDFCGWDDKDIDNPFPKKPAKKGVNQAVKESRMSQRDIMRENFKKNLGKRTII